MESIKLDLIPGKKMPSLHASQYDDGREHGIDLFENGIAYKLDGTETLTINERKGDDCICSLDIENNFADSNHIVFTSTEQMCAVWGNNICELVIAKGEKTIGTLNFILEIEQSPTEGGIESESEINNLHRQIDDYLDEVLPDEIAEEVPAIVEQVVGENYPTKQEVNQALEGKADATATTEALNSLAEAVRGKADASDIPTKTSDLQNDSNFASVDDAQASASKTYSSNKINSGLNTKASIDSANDYMLDTFNQCNYGTNRSLVNMLTDGYLTVSNELHEQTANKEKTTGFISVISGHYYNFLYNFVSDGWFRISQYDSNKNFLGVFDKNNIGEYRFVPTTEAYIRVSFRTFGNENVLSITDMIPQALTNSLGVTEYAGYIGNTGIFTRPTANKEVYTGYYALTENLSLTLTAYTKDKSERAYWCCYATYDENFAFISRTSIRSDSQPKLEILEHTLSQSDINTLISGGAKYIAFTYRTYDVITSVLTANYKKPFVEQKMSDLLCRKVLNIESLMPDVLRLNVVDVNKNIKSINHRGFNTAPENTLPAFKLSRQNGFAYVETDIRFTSDNVAVLLHDASINRTARNADGTAISGTVNIADITYAQALTYDFGVYKNASYAGTKIPTLEHFMALCRNIGLHPYLELRNDVNYTAEQYGIVYETVRNSGMLNNVSWISHGKAKLEEVLSRKPNARVGLLTDTLATGNITTVNEIKTSYPNADVFLNADYSTLNSTNLAYAINNETPLEVWTVNTDNAILGLDTYISGVTSDSKVAGNVTYNHDLT